VTTPTRLALGPNESGLASTRSPAATRQAVLESLVLPLLFTTVAGAGGFRMTVAGEMQFLRPTLFSLLLAALLVGTLVQSGLIRPAALVLERATLLESASGALLLVTLFAASAQVVSGLVPEQGLLALLFHLFFAVIFTNTLAANPDARHVLRSIAVTFGWTLFIKYVVLGAFEAEPSSLTAWAVRALVRGATLGGVPVEAWSPAVGYVMFAAVATYLMGLWLIGRAAPPPS
jgi:hypothetical protein